VKIELPSAFIELDKRIRADSFAKADFLQFFISLLRYNPNTHHSAGVYLKMLLNVLALR
jgi:hypothetical protein